MKCAVLTSAKQLEIIERAPPVCGPADVVVSVEVCGVCRTDRKAFHMGQRDLVMPRVLGHEIVATIQQTGAKVSGLKPGERVQVSPGVVCGVCSYCTSGPDNLCDAMQIIGFHLDGGFSELLLVPGSGGLAGLNKIPAGLDARSAVLTEPLACCVNLQKRLGLKDTQTVVIFGGGPLGLLSAQLARHLGVEKIIIVERMKSRRALAAQFSDCQLDFDDQTASRIYELTRGKGADAVLPCCPGSAPFLLGIEIAAKRGRIGFFSGLTDSAGITHAALNAIHYKELTVTGSYGCSTADNREALELLACGKVDTKGVPSLELSWQELTLALSHLEPQEHIFTYFYPA